MGLYINQEKSRSELQSKLAADLAEKAKKVTDIDNDNRENVDNNNRALQAKNMTWFWLIIFFVVFFGMLFIGQLFIS